MTPDEYAATLAPVYRRQGWRWKRGGTPYVPKATDIAQVIRDLLKAFDSPMPDGGEVMTTGTGRIVLMRDEPGENTISLSLDFGEVHQ